VVSVLLKVGSVYIIREVLSKYIYLLTLPYIVIIINFIGKSKYQLFYLWRDKLLE
jgi:hypothetical protein